MVHCWTPKGRHQHSLHLAFIQYPSNYNPSFVLRTHSLFSKHRTRRSLSQYILFDKLLKMKFSTATIIAFIGMSHALPHTLPAASTPCETSNTPAATPTGVQNTPAGGLGGEAPKVPDSATQAPDGDYAQPSASTPQPSAQSGAKPGGALGDLLG